jgi:hypothetical protein
MFARQHFENISFTLFAYSSSIVVVTLQSICTTMLHIEDSVGGTELVKLIDACGTKLYENKANSCPALATKCLHTVSTFNQYRQTLALPSIHWYHAKNSWLVID